MDTPRTVYIIDDDPGIRELLRGAIEASGTHAAVCSSTSDFHTIFDPEAVGCVLLDLNLSGENGLELHRQLSEQARGIPVIIITGFGEVEVAVETMRRGAFDFIEKPFHVGILLERVNQALARDAENLARRERRHEVEARFAALAPRESEVVTLLASGFSNREIATRFEISPQAVDARRVSAMAKLQVENLSDLVRLVVEWESRDDPGSKAPPPMD